jgi:tetratricopeptide (TPR) repeat protein
MMLLGFTFGEAAYAAQAGLSWQTTVVGDPLYRPFGKKPQQQHEELLAKKSKLIEWSHLKVANLNIVNNFPMDETIQYLETEGKTSAVLMEKLGDLYQGRNKPWLIINAYAQALNLKPSPQQEARLLLTLSEKLEAENRDEEALSMLKLLLRQSSDYPDALSLYKRMLSLANKLNKTEDATLFQREIQRLSGVPK